MQPFGPNALVSNPLTTQSFIMGICNLSENSLLPNHLLFIFKYYLYNAREDGNLSIEVLKASIYETKNIEKEISKIDPKEL